MGKNNRARRKHKTKKRRQKAKKERAKKDAQCLGPVWSVVEDPLGGLPDERRLEAIEHLITTSETLYSESQNKIKNILTRYSPLLALSILSSYALNVPVHAEAGVSKLDSEFEIYPSHIEILQAFALQINEQELGHDVFGPDVVQSIWVSLQELTESLKFKGLNPSNKNLTDEERTVALVQGLIRNKTRMVRNWGFLSQVKRIARELYSPFDEQVIESRGFGVSDVIDLFEALMAEVERRQTERFLQLRDLFKGAGKDKNLLVENYHELIGSTNEKAEEFIQKIGAERLSLDQLRSMILSHYDLCLLDSFIFDAFRFSESSSLDPDRVSAILDVFSLHWGSLESFEPEHTFLSNPIWTKPLISLGNNQYFCCLPSTFFSFIIPSLESLLTEHESGISDRRANYLEDRVAEIVASRFPAAKTVRNLKWKEGETVYESDVVTFIESFALIIECKSGKVTPPALRGAPDRLKKHVQELLIEPNVQSLRLKLLLQRLHQDPDLDHPIRAELPQDLSNVRLVCRVSVCLEDFGAIQSSMKSLDGTSWLPQGFKPCPTMNLADFETLFDLLEHPVQILHYLARREALETTVGFLADELDLLGFYLTTLFNIGDTQGAFFSLIGMSAPIDRYYNSMEAGIELKKPQPKISPMFAAIFSQLESRAPERWSEIGFALNMFSPDDQQKLVKGLPKIEKIVRRKWKVEGHTNMLIYSPPKATEYALAYVMFVDENENRRMEFIEHAAALALEPAHVQYVVVIGKNIDRDDLAYHTIAMFE